MFRICLDPFLNNQSSYKNTNKLDAIYVYNKYYINTTIHNAFWNIIQDTLFKIQSTTFYIRFGTLFVFRIFVYNVALRNSFSAKNMHLIQMLTRLCKNRFWWINYKNKNKNTFKPLFIVSRRQFKKIICCCMTSM